MSLDAAFGRLRAGDVEGAGRLCRQVLRREPGNPQALHLMGLVARHLGRAEEAARLMRKAARAQPRNADLFLNLAEAYRAAGRLDRALAAYAKARSIRPGGAAALIGIGEVELARGRAEAAEAALRAAVEVAPEDVVAWNALALALGRLGRAEAAIEAWRRAIAIDPARAEIHHNLGLALHDLGRWDEALATLLRAFALDGGHPAIRRTLAACLKNRAVVEDAPGLRAALASLIGAPGIDAQSLLPAALGTLETTPSVGRALTASDEAALLDAAREGLADEPLFLHLLEHSFVAKPAWERLLTRLRAYLFARPGAVPAGLVLALAQQGFNNEYAFWAEPAEEAAADALGQALDRRLADGPAPTPDLELEIACLAMYRPLAGHAGMERLLEIDAGAWSPPFRRLLDRQLRVPLEERAIAAAIDDLAAADDPASAPLRAMYEESPYPRWMTAASRAPRPAAEVLAGLFPHFKPPSMLARGRLDVLVAGCGTGRQAIDVAGRYRGARVLAIDLSRASLAYAQRMTRLLGVDNIDFRRGDILALGSLERRFQVIECTGVLHHIGGFDQARAAWGLLCDRLRPGGVMKIGLYSDRARRHLEPARRLIAEGGYPPTPDGIRRCRRDILVLSDDDPAREVARNRDFYALSACRDLLFHVHEHAYSPARINADLNALGLDFIGFELDNPEARAAYRAAYPQDEAMTDLANWEGFERDHPATFAGMYQFWCRKR